MEDRDNLNQKNELQDTADKVTFLSTLSLGLNVAVGMFVCSYAGFLLEQKYGQDYWTLGGIFVGLLYMSYQIWKIVKKT